MDAGDDRAVPGAASRRVFAGLSRSSDERDSGRGRGRSAGDRRGAATRAGSWWCGLGADGIGYVLADASVARARPEGWARGGGARRREAWGADRVIAEANKGGEMVASVLRGADVALPVKLVHASHGKAARAEPVAVLVRSRAGAARGHVPRAGGPNVRADAGGL